MLNNAGIFEAKKINECFMGTSKNGCLYFLITFETVCGEAVDWRVNLHDKLDSDKAKEMAQQTMNTLRMLGWIEGNKLSEMADKPVSELFGEFLDKVKLNVQMDTITKRDGTTYEKAVVAFVNVGESWKDQEKIDKKQAVVSLKGLPYDGWLIQSFKGETPSKRTMASETKKPVAESSFDTSDIPF